MRRWIIWILILITLVAGGFCLYWFAFRDTSDGGDLSNKEVLFALQSILEEKNIDLDQIVENHKKVTFTTKQEASIVASADSEKLTLAEKFNSSLVRAWGELVTINEAEFNGSFVKPLIFAYSALYEGVFEDKNFKQNNIYSQTIVGNPEDENSPVYTYKIKIVSIDEEIYVYLYDESTQEFNEMKITFDFRDETNIYSLENKRTITNKNGIGDNKDSYTYSYSYFNRNAKEILSYDNVAITLKQRITSRANIYDILGFELKSIYQRKDGKNYKLEESSLTDTLKNDILKYVVELGDLDVNFAEQDKLLNKGSGEFELLKNAFNYYK